MYYLIDGYNVINCSDMFVANTLELRRAKLINFITERSPQGKNSAAVVFDYKSPNPNEFGSYNKSHYGELEIIFSDGTLSADDVIADIAENSARPYEITVVTNDKGLRRRVAALGVKYEDVEVFIRRGQQAERAKSRASDIDGKKLNDITQEFTLKWLKK
jgi:predicted RNA-binding protein with PIN domain